MGIFAAQKEVDIMCQEVIKVITKDILVKERTNYLS